MPLEMLSVLNFSHDVFSSVHSDDYFAFKMVSETELDISTTV